MEAGSVIGSVVRQGFLVNHFQSLRRGFPIEPPCQKGCAGLRRVATPIGVGQALGKRTGQAWHVELAISARTSFNNIVPHIDAATQDYGQSATKHSATEIAKFS